MVRSKNYCCIFLLVIYLFASTVSAAQSGSVRGVVYDKDFDVPLSGVEITILESGEKIKSTGEGNFSFGQLKPGTYTLVFTKDGYQRFSKQLVVESGKMTEVQAWLNGEFTEMEEFEVKEVQIGTGSESQLLELRMDNPALLDSIGSDLMSKVGASDAASALKFVTGASVQDGKYAVIRGLPDRYVNSQMNGVRLPTADADKRAVQLDQFPSQVIESIQVSKTFTPDQQGDASGGAVNVVLKGIPDEATLKLEYGMSYNSQASGNDKFMSFKGGGVNRWGSEDRSPQLDKLGESWSGAAGVSPAEAPQDYKWSVSGGGKLDFDDFRIGGFASFYYERDSSFFDDGIDDKYTEEDGVIIPRYSQGSPSDGTFYTSLFDVTQAGQSVQWGGLGVLGFESEDHTFNFLYMHTQDAEEKVTLAENTRGKDFFFPGYDINNPEDPANTDGKDASPFLRLETLKYVERSTDTYQFNGWHRFSGLGLEIGSLLNFLEPELDWTIALSSATLNEPDKRQFGSQWTPASYVPGVKGRLPFPPFSEYWIRQPSVDSEKHLPYKPASNFTMGNFQRTWRRISEDSTQYKLNLKLPFEQWTGDEGYLKFGWFNDSTVREYDQESFANFGEVGAEYLAGWDDYWSSVFADEDHPITASYYDIDYRGDQEISAWYYMADIPLYSDLNIIGGVRYESTEMSIKNFPDRNESGDIIATWLPPGSTGPAIEVIEGEIFPYGPDAEFSQSDVLPSLGFEFRPWEEFTVRGSYSETVARATFKELSPIMQSEYLGGDVFIGNPGLQMSSLKNYDLRFDYTPYKGSLMSFSWFKKDIKGPIEYVGGQADFSYTYPINFPKGQLSGYEVEVRQDLEHFFDFCEGISVGANATWIDSEVTIPVTEEESAALAAEGKSVPTRDMTNAPKHLYNLYLSYSIPDTGTNLGLYYNIRGDTLVRGFSRVGQDINIYETEYGTLNFTLSQKLGGNWKLGFKAKNLLNPDIQSVYRGGAGDDIIKTSYRKGIEYSVGLSATF